MIPTKHFSPQYLFPLCVKENAKHTNHQKTGNFVYLYLFLTLLYAADTGHHSGGKFTV